MSDIGGIQWSDRCDVERIQCYYVVGHRYVVPRPHVLCAILSKSNATFLRVEVAKRIPVLLFLCWVVECCGVREGHVGPEDTRKAPTLVLVSGWLVYVSDCTLGIWMSCVAYLYTSTKEFVLKNCVANIEELFQ